MQIATNAPYKLYRPGLVAAQRAQERIEQRSARPELEAPGNWFEWLPALFSNLFYYPFADHQRNFLGHIESIRPGIKPPAFFAIWPRCGSKSTNAEAAAVYVGARVQGIERRKFCLYTRATQDKANESVSNISAMLENDQVARYYPQLAERKIGKYGNSKGWRVNTLRCANGFNVVALGYDAAVRGIKIEEYRPDVIFIDDVDEKGDTLEIIEKKIKTLTHDILPAGSNDVAVIGIQNLVHYNSIFKRIADGKADFLYDRVVSGPYPAIEGLEYEARPERGYTITAGHPIWQGQDLETCERQMNEWGLDAFLEEAQHVATLKKGRVYHAYIQPGPDASTLDYSKAQGYWHAHDFGAVNEVWGLFVKIEGTYYLIYEQMLPEATTASRAGIIKEVTQSFLGESSWREKVVAGYGGAKGEKQQRIDYRHAGVDIRLPDVNDVESQINTTNKMLEAGELVICSNCVHTVDHLEHCIRDSQGKILNESMFHYAAMIRYFCAGVGSGLHWAR